MSMYLCWARLAPDEGRNDNAAGGVGEVVRFVVIGIQTTFDRLGQLPGVSYLVLAVLVVGTVCVVDQQGLDRVRRTLAVPIGMVSAASPIATAGSGWTMPTAGVACTVHSYV